MPDILSVGIDIGTSTTQLVFSRITMENTTGYFTVPRISIVDKEVIYKSTVHITPLVTPVLIDGEATLKRVRLGPDSISLMPENPMYRPIILWGEEMNQIQILGKAVAFTASLS